MAIQFTQGFDPVEPGLTFVPALAGPNDPPTDPAGDAGGDPGGRSLWFLFQGDSLIVAAAGDTHVPLAGTQQRLLGLAPLRHEYVGYWQDAAGRIDCFAGELPQDATLPAGLAALDLRRLFGLWPDEWVDLAGRAKQLSHWDRDHQFCSRCGAPSESMPAERARRCPACGLTSYPRISPAIIIAVTRQTEQGEEILLARNHRFPAGFFSVLAGFVEPGETLEECAAREVYEEVGVQIRNVAYFGSQPWPFPNSLMIGFTGEYASGEINLEESEIAEAQWFRADDLPNLPPPISIARKLINAFVARARR